MIAVTPPVKIEFAFKLAVQFVPLFDQYMKAPPDPPATQRLWSELQATAVTLVKPKDDTPV
jgi:hypothetical protein